jgi:hypothetical protein
MSGSAVAPLEKGEIVHVHIAVVVKVGRYVRTGGSKAAAGRQTEWVIGYLLSCRASLQLVEIIGVHVAVMIEIRRDEAAAGR